MSERVVSVTLRAQVAEYKRGMLEAATATRTLGSEAEKLAQKREAFQTLGRGLVVTGAAMVAATALTVRAAAQWESAWAGVTKTVEGTPEQLERVEQGLRDLSKVLPASHDEIAAVAEAAGQLGIQTDNVVAFTKTMIDLGETTNLSATDAATALARFTNIMGTSQDEVSNLGSAIVGLGNNYATTEREILEMSMRLAGAGKQIGLTEGDVLGLATALSSVGIEAEAGGSAMSKVMIDIASSVEQGGERLEMFAKAAGMSADTFAKKWRTSPSEALAAFVKGLSNAEAQGSSTLSVLAELGITEVRMRDALLRSASAADQFSGAMARGNEEFEKNNALTEEAAKRYETVESKIAIAGNAINDAAISFGEVLLPAVAAAADAVAGFADFLGGLTPELQGLITVTAGVAGMIALAGGTALIAVPRIAQFTAAMETMKWSMRGLATVGGIVGITLTAVVTIIGAVAAAQAQARQRAETYAAALRQGSDAAEEMVRNLQEVDTGLLGLQNFGSALDSAETLGLSLKTVSDAIRGVDSAMREVDAAIEAGKNGFNQWTREGLDARNAAVTLEEAVRRESEAFVEGSRVAGQATKALGETTAAADDAEGSFTDMGDAALVASGALDDMEDALRAIAGTAMGMGEAVDRAQSAVNKLGEAAKAEGATLHGLDDASIALRDSIRDVEQAHRDSAKSILENGGSLQDATAEWAKGREAVIQMRISMGESREEAVKWADENVGSASEVEQALTDVRDAVVGIPDRKTIAIEANTWPAENAIDRLVRTYNGTTLRLNVATDSFHIPNNYRGNLYEKGIPHYASGGIPSGIYAGVQGGIFAERERGVPWEAYISGRAADRDRNIGIWMETGHKLGMSAAAPAPLNLDGLSITGTLEIGGDGLARIINGHIVANANGQARVVRGRLTPT